MSKNACLNASPFGEHFGTLIALDCLVVRSFWLVWQDTFTGDVSRSSSRRWPAPAVIMNPAANGCSVFYYLKPKRIGRMRSRLQEIKNPLRATSPPDLSHSESARLAVDALVDRDLTGYQDVLRTENEVDFLSTEEKTYILQKLQMPVRAEEEEDKEEMWSSQTCSPPVTDSDPPSLVFDWPVAEGMYHLRGVPSTEVFFHSDGRSSMKDRLRSLIREASEVLAIVTDTFSDVEIFCDLLEASRKRSVCVYLLLDHTNLQMFKDMCADANVDASQFSRISIRSIEGETYCAKSGRKFSGRVKDTFLIVDCAYVLVGSYSISWLCWQVHRSMAVLFKGSGVKPFDLEFRRLYANSKPVPGLCCSTDQYPTNPAANHQPSPNPEGECASLSCPADQTASVQHDWRSEGPIVRYH